MQCIEISQQNTLSRMVRDFEPRILQVARFQTSRIEMCDFKRFTQKKKRYNRVIKINVYIVIGFYLPRYSWFEAAFTDTMHSRKTTSRFAVAKCIQPKHACPHERDVLRHISGSAIKKIIKWNFQSDSFTKIFATNYMSKILSFIKGRVLKLMQLLPFYIQKAFL